MTVSLIIPAFNEEGCIGKTLREIPQDIADEIIVVDGHSTDNTVSEARMVLGKRGRVITQTRNGFGGALRDGIDAARGDIIIIMDADGSHDPHDIQKLLSRSAPNTVVLASRYAKGGRSEDDTLIRWFGNWFFTRLTNFVHGTHVTDSLFFFFSIPRDAIKNLALRSDGFGICIELLVKAQHAGLRFEEVPTVEWRRLAGASKVHAFRDGVTVLRAILHRYDADETLES